MQEMTLVKNVQTKYLTTKNLLHQHRFTHQEHEYSEL